MMSEWGGGGVGSKSVCGVWGLLSIRGWVGYVYEACMWKGG